MRRVSVAGVLDEIDQEDRVRDDYPDQEQDPEQGRDAEGHARQQEGPEGAGGGERDSEEDDQG